VFVQDQVRFVVPADLNRIHIKKTNLFFIFNSKFVSVFFYRDAIWDFATLRTEGQEGLRKTKELCINFAIKGKGVYIWKAKKREGLVLLLLKVMEREVACVGGGGGGR
jgi:hypothetical protein